MMDEFEHLLNEAMDAGADPDQIRDALTLVDQIKTTEEHLTTLKEQLSAMGDGLCAAASVELRKLLPKMETRQTRAGCIFTYKARSIMLAPDFQNGTWNITPGPSPRDKQLLTALAEKERTFPLDQYKEMVRTIAQLFVGRYKTLQGGQVEPYAPAPDEAEIKDDQIDSALNKTEPATPEADVSGAPVEPHDISKTPGGVHYA